MDDEVHEETKYPRLGFLSTHKTLSESFSGVVNVDVEKKLDRLSKRIEFQKSRRKSSVFQLQGNKALRRAFGFRFCFLKLLGCFLVFPCFTNCLLSLQDPEGIFLVYFYFLILMSSLYNICTIVFRVCYLLPVAYFKEHFYIFFVFIFFDLISDLIYALDLLLFGWFRPYYSKNAGWLVSHRIKTIFHYLKTGFFIDFISTIPLDYAYFLIIGIICLSLQDTELFYNLIRWIPILRANRCFKIIFRYTKIFHHFEMNIAQIPPFIIRIAKYYVLVLLGSHLLACIWFVIIDNEEPQNGMQFTGIVGFRERSIYEIHFFYFHWVYVLITGYGGTIPSTFQQIAYANLAVFAGIVSSITIIGIVSSIVSDVLNVDASKRQSFQKVKLYMKSKGVPRNLRKQIIQYYSFMFENERQWNEKTILSSLPTYIRAEVAIEMNYDVVKKVKIFQNASRTFISSVVLQLQPRFVLPNQRIISQGEVGREMFFLTRGRVGVEINGVGRVAVLEEGKFFGEIALLKNTVRNATIKALTFCDLYLLTKESFIQLEKEYPREVGWIRMEAKSREVKESGKNKKSEEEIEDLDLKLQYLNRLLRGRIMKNRRRRIKEEKKRKANQDEIEEKLETPSQNEDHSNESEGDQVISDDKEETEIGIQTFTTNTNTNTAITITERDIEIQSEIEDEEFNELIFEDGKEIVEEIEFRREAVDSEEEEEGDNQKEEEKKDENTEEVKEEEKEKEEKN